MTTLVRWEPFRELSSLHGDMNKWLNDLFESHGRADTRNWMPALDVWETDKEVVYAFDLPGIPEDKIAIEVKDETLTVSAVREKTEEVSDDRFYRFERRYGSFSRAVGLPQGVDEDKIVADYRDGVLEVRVPKPQEQQPRKIALSKTVNGKSKAA
jgi:HSP20 family protein